jgi:uncharacterized protein
LRAFPNEYLEILKFVRLLCRFVPTDAVDAGEAQSHARAINGHFHPKADLFFRGTYIFRPCFFENGEKMVLSAFGTYTGGLSVSDPAFSRIFQSSPRCYILGAGKVYLQ